MTNAETITYTCEVCGYQNTWTRSEILQRGKKEVYRDMTINRYSLPCKNPTARPSCPGRHVVGVPREEQEDDE